MHLLGSIVRGGAVCCMVVTTISGVRTVPFERLRRFGFTLLISIRFLSSLYYNCSCFSAETDSCLLHFAKIMQTSAMKACFQKEESTPYDGVDSLKQILVLSTFQFIRFQPTELNSLLVSTR